MMMQMFRKTKYTDGKYVYYVSKNMFIINYSNNE